MNEDRQRILKMVAEGKISVEDAGQLLSALGKGSESAEGASAGEAVAVAAPAKPRPKFLRVQMQNEAAGQARMDVRVPLALIRAGVKISSLIPKSAQENINTALASQGISLDLNGLDAKTLDELVDAIGELRVDLNQGPNKVQVFCE